MSRRSSTRSRTSTSPTRTTTRSIPLVRATILVRAMKTEIHPEYAEATVRCTCGNEFVTRSTKGDMHVEICSNCHPLYTGKQKLVDTGGRVERFQRKLARSGARRK